MSAGVERWSAALRVVGAAWERQAPTAIVAVTALEDAGLLNSPETAAELVAFRKEGALPMPVGPESAHVAPCRWPLSPDCACGPSVEVSADRLTRLLAPVQALREDPHDGPLAHDYRIPRDLPETGGSA